MRTTPKIVSAALGLCALLPVFATARDASLRELAASRKAEVVTLAHETQSDVDKDPIARLCGSFRMTRAEVRQYLRLSHAISASEFDHGQDWVPCIMRATLRARGREFSVEISASGSGKLLDARTGKCEYLACEGRCRRIALRER